VIARKEYLEGTYKEQEKTIENEIFVAQETLKKAQLSYDSTKRLVSRGLLTQLQLEARSFAWMRPPMTSRWQEQAACLGTIHEAENADAVGQRHPSGESEVQRSDTDSYRKNEQAEGHRRQMPKLPRCRTGGGTGRHTPRAEHPSGSEFVVEAGSMVRERQVVIRLPDTKDMHVKPRSTKSRINLVHEGLARDDWIDAFGDETLQGR